MDGARMLTLRERPRPVTALAARVPPKLGPYGSAAPLPSSLVRASRFCMMPAVRARGSVVSSASMAQICPAYGDSSRLGQWISASAGLCHVGLCGCGV
jgi:hypothetical protein